MNTLVFPAQAQTAAAARRAIAASAPLDPIRLAEAQLMVTELVANAIQHAGLHESDQLSITIEPDVVAVRIGIQHQAKAPIASNHTGLGFSLIDRLSRRWGVEWADGLAEVWFEVRPAGTGAALSELSNEEVLSRSKDDVRFRDEAVARFRSLSSVLAGRFRGKGIADADLEQVALLGLLNAITRFDADKGAFEPYAAATIQGELKRHLRDRAWSVRVPRGLQDLSLLVGRTAESLAQSLGRAATPGDIARELDISEEEVVEAIAANSAYRWESIDAPNEETGTTLAETIREDDDWAVPSEDWHELSQGIRSLPARERRLIYLRFYQDLTQTEIAAQMGMSQMHVSRLLARALELLREKVE